MTKVKAKIIAAKKGKKTKKGKESKVEKVLKKTKEKVAEKATKKTKKVKASKSSDFSPRSKDQDEYVIKRLIQENPRRAGSEKAKIWDRLKKGMTVSQFVDKGGSRASIARYVQNGWVKLLRPSGSKGDE